MAELDYPLPPPAQPGDETVEQIIARRRAANATASGIAGANANPDQAARSLGLSRATGVHPSVIDLEPDNFEQRFKEQDAAARIQASPDIQKYLLNYPLANKVSNDDYEALDNASQSVRRLTGGVEPELQFWENREFWKNTWDIFKEGLEQVVASPLTAIGAGGAAKEQTAEAQKFLQEKPPSLVEAVTGGAIKAPFAETPLSEGAAKAAAAAAARRSRGGEAFQQFVMGTGQAALSPFIGAFRTYASQPIEEATGFPKEVTEGLTMAGLGVLGMRGMHTRAQIEAVLQKAREFRPDVQKILERAKELHDIGDTYLKSGELPPAGVHPDVSEAYAKLAKEDAQALKQAQADVAKAATGDRDPDGLEEFLRGPSGDKTIGISADAIRKAYGEGEVPEPGDGKFGWIPNIATELEGQSGTGGFVDAPLSAWLRFAKEKPDLAKAVEDNVLVRPKGYSPFEVEERARAEVKEEPKYIDTVEDLARAEAHLAPIVESGQTARLKLVERSPDGFDTFEIVGDTGKIGKIEVQLTPKGLLYVQDWESTLPSKVKPQGLPSDARGVWALGLTNIRALARELQRQYPEAKDIGGWRVSGARAAGEVDKTGWVQIPLKRLIEDPKEFAQAIGWERVEPTMYRNWLPPERTDDVTINMSPGHEARITHSLSTKNILKDLDFTELKGIPKILASFLRGKFEQLAGDVRIHVISGADMDQYTSGVWKRTGVPGFYDSDSHIIVMNREFMRGNYPEGTVAHVIMHEVAHAVTVRAMGNSILLNGKVVQLMNMTDKWLQENDRLGRKEHYYAFINEKEFIAEAFSNPRFQKHLARIELDPGVAEKFGMSPRTTRTAWDMIRNFVRDAIEKLIGEAPSDTVMDALLKLGEEFERVGMEEKASAEDMYKRGEMAPAPPVEPDPLFENAKAVGLSKADFELYQKQIAARNAEDEARQLVRKEKEARRAETREWKENYKDVKAEMTELVTQRNDVALDNFIRNYKGGRVKLNSEELSEGQKASLPKEYYGVGGFSPSALAGHFGFTSSEALVTKLSTLVNGRKAMGLTPKEYTDQVIKDLTDKAMRERYGDLEENILREAREAVRTHTDMERLNQEYMMLAQASGEQTPMTLDAMKKGAANNFGNKIVADAKDPGKWIRDSSRAGVETERALQRGKATEAFKAKQQHLVSDLFVREAQKFERELEKGQQFFKTYGAAKLTSMPQEYLDQIHGIFQLIGVPVKRSLQNVAEAVAAGGGLRQFVEERTDPQGIYKLNMPVFDELLDGLFQKRIDEMKVWEFRAVMDSVRAIAKAGRDELKVGKEEQEIELAKVKGKMIDEASVYKPVSEAVLMGKNKIRATLRSVMARTITQETWLDRLSRGDPRGFWNTQIADRMSDMSREEIKLTAEVSKEIKANKYKGNLKETINNPFIKHTVTGKLIKLTREEFLQVLSNMGNHDSPRSNAEKFIKGYKIDAADKEAFWEWVKQTAKPEDWEYVRNRAKTFDRLFKMGQEVDQRDSGLKPDPIPVGKAEPGVPEGKINIAPKGQKPEIVDGWYHPVIYDKTQPGNNARLERELNDNHYHTASTPRSWQKDRTGYVQAISLDSSAYLHRVAQIVHDITFREGIRDIAKLLRDPEVKNAISRLSPEAARGMDDWVRLKSGAFSTNWTENETFATIDRVITRNVMSLFVPFNISIVAKHTPTALGNSVRVLALDSTARAQAVAAAKFTKALATMFTEYDNSGMTGWKFVMENSKEIPLRHAFFADQAGVAHNIAMGKSTMAEWWNYAGSYPVALGDSLSAKPMWLVAYGDALHELKMTKEEAVTYADNKVRDAHGSIVSKPLIVSDLPKMITPLYGFWNNQLQGMMKLGWEAGDRLGINRTDMGGTTEFIKSLPGLAAKFFTLYVFPVIMIDAAVSHYKGEEKDPWWLWFGKTNLAGLGSFFPGIREGTSAIKYGADPTLGVWGNAIKPTAELARDIQGWAKGRHKDAELVKDLMEIMTILKRVPGEQAAKVIEMAIRAAEGQAGGRVRKGVTGIEEPFGAFIPGKTGDVYKGISGNIPGSIMYGIRHGTTLPPSH